MGVFDTYRGGSGNTRTLRRKVKAALDELAASGPELTSYSNLTRPAASTIPAGGSIWNTDDNAPNWSDGTDWRDALGNVT